MLQRNLKSIQNVLVLLILTIFLTNCSGVKTLEIFKQEVPREKLNLNTPTPLELENLKWIIITSKNAEEVFKRLEEQGIDSRRNLKNTNFSEPPPLYALAIGLKDGESASCGTVFNSSDLISMGEATGIPLACGLKLLVEGKIIKKGVFAPEGAINPNEFFEELANISDLLDTNGSELISIFRSWM